MTVALDAKGSKLIGATQVSSINYTGITVGSVSDGALIATLTMGDAVGSSGWAATWDSGGTNQAMTLISSKVNGVASAVIFGLRNPTPGKKTLALSWTGANYPSVCAISFSGVEQSSDANAFKNAISGTSASLGVTSASGDMALAVAAASGSLTTFNQTALYLDTTSNGADSAASYAAGASSVTFTIGGGSGSLALSGIDISAIVATTNYGYLRLPPRPLLRR